MQSHEEKFKAGNGGLSAPGRTSCYPGKKVVAGISRHQKRASAQLPWARGSGAAGADDASDVLGKIIANLASAAHHVRRTDSFRALVAESRRREIQFYIRGALARSVVRHV